MGRLPDSAVPIGYNQKPLDEPKTLTNDGIESNLAAYASRLEDTFDSVDHLPYSGLFSGRKFRESAARVVIACFWSRKVYGEPPVSFAMINDVRRDDEGCPQDVGVEQEKLGGL